MFGRGAGGQVQFLYEPNASLPSACTLKCRHVCVCVCVCIIQLMGVCQQRLDNTDDLQRGVVFFPLLSCIGNV